VTTQQPHTTGTLTIDGSYDSYVVNFPVETTETTTEALAVVTAKLIITAGFQGLMTSCLKRLIDLRNTRIDVTLTHEKTQESVIRTNITMTISGLRNLAENLLVEEYITDRMKSITKWMKEQQ